MPKPLDSVIALARFSLNDDQRAQASELLQVESDWSRWLREIELHALSGFASMHIEQHDLPVPAETIIALRALKLRHQSASEARYIALQEIDTIFKQHSIPYLGLKGVCLMPMIFQQPELRPMRDMDLLIPQANERLAVQCMREIGFDLPDQEENVYMREMHQLPNATKTINGFTISVELHHDGYTRDTGGSLRYPESEDLIQQIQWNELQLNAFEDITLLNQVSRHTEGSHPNSVLKLINVMDVIGMAEYVRAKGNWKLLQERLPHISSTLSSLHLYTPLPDSLQAELGELPKKRVSGVGEIMTSLKSNILAKNMPLKTRFKRLFLPSDWWLHLYYNVHPDKTLFWVKVVRHPARIVSWLANRALSRIRGG